MDTLLEAIDVCDVDGFCYGNYTDEEAGTGCTVIVAPEGATGGVDVRGGAPASRETDLLRPENTVDKVHAVCLSGGSAFGLEAASGVARELESRGIGLPVGPTQVPIVCSSCIFDLAYGDPTVRPDIEAGIAAVREAYTGPDADWSRPCYSPLFADLRGLPPTLVQVGTNEILKSDSERLVENLQKAGVYAQLEVYPECWHVFQQMPIRRAAVAMESAGRFVQRII